MQQPTYFIVYSVQSCNTQEPTFGRPPGTEFSTSGGESRVTEGAFAVSLLRMVPVLLNLVQKLPVPNGLLVLCPRDFIGSIF